MLVSSGCIQSPRTLRKRQPSFRRDAVRRAKKGSRLPQAIHRIHRVLRDHTHGFFRVRGQVVCGFCRWFFKFDFCKPLICVLDPVQKQFLKRQLLKHWLWNGPLMSLIYLMAVFKGIEYCCNALYCTLFFYIWHAAQMTEIMHRNSLVDTFGSACYYSWFASRRRIDGNQTCQDQNWVPQLQVGL